MFYVYILKSLKAKRFYVGYTNDLLKRLKTHNAKKVKSTRPFGPWKVIYTENFATKSEAMKREYFLKHTSGRKEKLDIIRRIETNNGEFA